MAALEGHVGVVELLHSVDPSTLELCVPDTGQTPCHFAARWIKNKQSRTVPVLLWICRKQPRLLEVEDSRGNSSIKIVADNLFEGSHSDARKWLSDHSGTVLPSTVPITKKEVAKTPAPAVRDGDGAGSMRPWDQCDEKSDRNSKLTPSSGEVTNIPELDRKDADDHGQTDVVSQPAAEFYAIPGNQLSDRREYVNPHAHTNTSDLFFWKKEFMLVRDALGKVFGCEAADAMLRAWGVDENIPRYIPVDPDPTQGGNPVGYENIGRGKTAIDELIEVSRKGDIDGMESAFNQIPADCTWEHLPVYKCLALAGCRHDCDDVRHDLVKYAEGMILRNVWDPAMLLSASRAARIQGWSRSTRHILLALYLALFQKQAMSFMSKDDHHFWENSGLGDDAEPKLLSKNAVESKKKGVEEDWVSLKQSCSIQSASMDELMTLTGLQQVKLEAVAIVKKLLSDRKLKEQQRVVTTCNFAFMGNPGTGVFGIACSKSSVCTRN